MSNSVRAHERRRERALQCQYENRMHRNALRNSNRIPLSQSPIRNIETVTIPSPIILLWKRFLNRIKKILRFQNS